MPFSSEYSVIPSTVRDLLQLRRSRQRKQCSTSPQVPSSGSKSKPSSFSNRQRSQRKGMGIARRNPHLAGIPAKLSDRAVPCIQGSNCCPRGLHWPRSTGTVSYSTPRVFKTPPEPCFEHWDIPPGNGISTTSGWSSDHPQPGRDIRVAGARFLGVLSWLRSHEATKGGELSSAGILTTFPDPSPFHSAITPNHAIRSHCDSVSL